LSGVPSTNGVFNFSVQATDSLGTNALAALTITIVTPLITLMAPMQTSDQIASVGFQFYVQSDSPGTYAIDYTTNFTNWTLLQTIQYTNGQSPIVDLGAGQLPSRSYRAHAP
ncbi:MAG TPA: hypothetical protein VLU94_02180, partial [Candidatus Nitrosotalea sp.]|nr:hypothetical protein [Candidatus Nitrosotalea sp.]